MSRSLMALCATLIALLTFVLWYSWPAWVEELGPRGAITFNLIPELTSLVVEVAIVAGVVSLLNDRKWRVARSTIKSHFEIDIRNIAAPLFALVELWADSENGKWFYKRKASRAYKQLLAALNSTELIDQLQFLAPAMTPELATTAGIYMDSKNRLRRCLADMDPSTFLFMVIGVEDLEVSAEAIAQNHDYTIVHSAYHASLHLRTLMDLVLRDLSALSGEPWFNDLTGMFGETEVLAEALKIMETSELLDEA